MQMETLPHSSESLTPTTSHMGHLRGLTQSQIQRFLPDFQSRNFTSKVRTDMRKFQPKE